MIDYIVVPIFFFLLWFKRTAATTSVSQIDAHFTVKILRNSVSFNQNKLEMS